MSRSPAARQCLPRPLLVGLAFGLWMAAVPGLAQQVTAPATAAAPVSESEPAELTIANRPIFTLRADAFGRPPRDRVAAIQPMVAALIERGGPLEMTTAETSEGVVVLVDGSPLFRVLNGDANPEAGETPRSIADHAVGNLNVALRELREARDASALLPAVLHSLAATGIAAVVLGAPLYIGSWQKDAQKFLTEHREALTQRPVAIFTLGPTGTDAQEWEGVRGQLAQQMAKVPWLKPIATGLFGGKYDPAHLRFPASDVRDWAAIRAWAGSLPALLQPVLAR